MPSYCVYSVDEEGYALGFDVFDAEDDEAAIADCHKRAKHHALELWSGSRKIARLDGHERPLPPG